MDTAPLHTSHHRHQAGFPPTIQDPWMTYLTDDTFLLLLYLIIKVKKLSNVVIKLFFYPQGSIPLRSLKAEVMKLRRGYL